MMDDAASGVDGALVWGLPQSLASEMGSKLSITADQNHAVIGLALADF